MTQAVISAIVAIKPTTYFQPPPPLILHTVLKTGSTTNEASTTKSLDVNLVSEMQKTHRLLSVFTAQANFSQHPYTKDAMEMQKHPCYSTVFQTKIIVCHKVDFRLFNYSCECM